MTNSDLPATAPDIENSPNPPFTRMGDWVESHGFISLVVFLAIYLCAELGYSLRIPLWHDELFTWYIAQAPSVHTLLHLTETIDLNPPLSYLLTRASFHLFGVGTLQTRLPEIAGFGLALVCVSIFVRRRAGNAFGILAAAILFSSKASEPAIDGRPYGLMFGFGALMLVAWQSSTIAKDRGSLMLFHDLLLASAACALLLTHVFGILLWAAIVIAEATCSYERKRLAPSRLVALFLPLAATWLYAPLLRRHAAGTFPPAFQAHLSDIFSFYASRATRELASLGLTIVCIAAVAGHSWLRPARRFVLTRPEWVALVGILAIPVVLISSLTQQHGAFFYRYGDIATLGIAILLSVLFCRLTANRPAAAVFAIILFLIFSARLQRAFLFASQGNIFRHSEPTIVPFHLDTAASANLPLVINSGIVFVEMNNHEATQLLDRTFYLTGGSVAIHYTNANIFEGMAEEVKAFHLHGHAEPYLEFIQKYPHFYLLASDHDYPEDWLLRKLPADGAQVRVLGRIENSYRDHELYEVTFPIGAY